MPVAQFPTPDIGGAQYSKLLPNIVGHGVPEFATVEKVFKDLGSNVELLSIGSVQRWGLTYEGLEAAEAAAFDAHYASAFGIWAGFQFRDPRTGILWNDVHYESMTADHEKTWTETRTIVLIKRPS